MKKSNLNLISTFYDYMIVTNYGYIFLPIQIWLGVSSEVQQCLARYTIWSEVHNLSIWDRQVGGVFLI